MTHRALDLPPLSTLRSGCLYDEQKAPDAPWRQLGSFGAAVRPARLRRGCPAGGCRLSATCAAVLSKPSVSSASIIAAGVMPRSDASNLLLEPTPSSNARLRGVTRYHRLSDLTQMNLDLRNALAVSSRRTRGKRHFTYHTAHTSDSSVTTRHAIIVATTCLAGRRIRRHQPHDARRVNGRSWPKRPRCPAHSAPRRPHVHPFGKPRR